MDNQSPIQPQMPVQQAPQPFEPKKPLPKWPLLITGVILIVTLLTGAYLLGKNQGMSQKLALTTPTPTQTIAKPTSAPTSIPDATASWKTFNNQYLSFKYPASLKIVDPYSAPLTTPDLSKNIGLIPLDKTLGGSVPPIVITRFDNPKNLNLQQWEAENNAAGGQASSYYKSTTKTTLIDNKTAYFNENANCEPYACYQVFVMGKDNIFEFFNVDYGDYPQPGASGSQIYTRAEQNNLKTIFQEILDNVKFTP